jgi:hypothetical protein
MSAHTPGPWAAIDNGHCWSVESKSHWIASTQFCFATETEANARLIAAAPELLAALVELVKQHKNIRAAESYPTTNSPATDAADAAIAKATGEGA